MPVNTDITSASTEAGAKLVTEEDIRRTDYSKAIQFRVPGLLPLGLTVLVAAPKIGKSWLRQEFEHALGAEKELLGWTSPHPIRCLVIDLEGAENLTHVRSWSLQKSGDFSLIDYVYSVDIPTTWSERLMWIVERLDTAKREGRPYGYVAVDTLRPFLGQRDRGQDAYTADKVKLDRLNQVANGFNLALVGVHHTNNSEGTGDPLDKINGSSAAFGGSASQILILDRGRQETDGTLQVVGRYVEDASYPLTFTGGRWEFTQDLTVAQAESSGAARAILDELIVGGTMSRKELTDATGYTATAVNQALHRLHKRLGYITYRDEKWRLSDLAREVHVPKLPDMPIAPPPGTAVVDLPKTPAAAPVAEPTPVVVAPVVDDDEDTPEALNGYRMLQDAIAASRMKPVMRLPAAVREQEPWSLVTERMAGEFRWTNPNVAVPNGHKVAVFDRNGSYPSALGSVPLAPNLLKHTGHLDKRPTEAAGLFLINPVEWLDDRIGHPLGPIADQPGPWWITTPHMMLLEKLAHSQTIPPPVIVDSWTGRKTDGLFTSFSKMVKEARERTRHDPQAYTQVKLTTSQAIRSLWPKGSRSPFYRPDWHISARAEASVRHWVRALQAVNQGAVLLRLGSVDEVALLAPGEADNTWKCYPYQLGVEFGQVKHKGDVVIGRSPDGLVKAASPLTGEQWTQAVRSGRR